MATLVVIVIVIVTLLRWFSHLSTFGRMADVIDRVEKAATASVEMHAARPTLGARAATPLPPGAATVHAAARAASARSRRHLDRTDARTLRAAAREAWGHGTA